MNLRKLHEKASWQKLNEQDFRTKTTSLILEHEEAIEKFAIITEQLTNDLFALRKQLGIMNLQNVKLNRKLNTTRADNDNTQTEQKRDSGSISQSGKPHI